MEDSGFLQRLDAWARKLVPLLLGVVSVFVMAMPLPGSVLARLVPWLSLIVVFYWSLYRSDLMNPLPAFLIGLLQDLLLGAWLGVNAFTLLLVYAASLTQQRVLVGRGFWLIWAGFAVISILAELVKYLLVGVLNAELASLWPMGVRWLATMALFPPVAWVMILLHRHVLDRV